MFRKLLCSSQPTLPDEFRPDEDPTASSDIKIKSSQRYFQTEPH